MCDIHNGYLGRFVRLREAAQLALCDALFAFVLVLQYE